MRFRVLGNGRGTPWFRFRFYFLRGSSSQAAALRTACYWVICELRGLVLFFVCHIYIAGTLSGDIHFPEGALFGVILLLNAFMGLLWISNPSTIRNSKALTNSVLSCVIFWPTFGTILGLQTNPPNGFLGPYFSCFWLRENTSPKT